MNEPKLIKQLKSGSQEAFDGIYEFYSKRLFGFCFQYTKSRENAEEIVQDVFVKLWNYRENIQQETSLKSFLFTIAKNQLINSYRSRINSPVYEEYVNHCNNHEISVNDTSHRIEYDQFCRELELSLRKLPKTQQDVFNCCKIKQLSNKETSEFLSLSEQTVKNQLSLCLKTLRNDLKNLPIWAFFLFNL